MDIISALIEAMKKIKQLLFQKITFANCLSLQKESSINSQIKQNLSFRFSFTVLCFLGSLRKKKTFKES